MTDQYITTCREALEQRWSGFDSQIMSDLINRDILLLMLKGNETALVQRNAAWALTHLESKHNPWLQLHQAELVDISMTTPHEAVRRLTLTLLLRTEMADSVRADFIDFLFTIIAQCEEAAGVQSAAIRLAYRFCSPYPELLAELRQTLLLAEERMQYTPDRDAPAVRSARNKTLNLCSQKL